jgi:hypothetical protein
MHSPRFICRRQVNLGIKNEYKFQATPKELNMGGCPKVFLKINLSFF